jgi:hypothetical protein
MANHLSYDVLSRLVERRASPVEEAKAQRHLARCGRCRSELAWLERIHSLPAGGSEHEDFSMRPAEGGHHGWARFDDPPSPASSRASAYWAAGTLSPRL